jgi:hypothetical protein
MKILTIGNSFAVNSCKYLSEICRDGGVEIQIGCANIGGCSLERHWNNVLNDTRQYGNTFNGEKTLLEMLESEKWDFVTLQQASPLSWKIGAYYPYIDNLAAYIKEHAPTAEIIIHETWAYRTDNENLCKNFQISQSQMFELIKENYIEIATKLSSRILPVGEAYRIMQLETGDTVGELTRNPDGPSHANSLGEYIGGLVWYTVLTGNDIDKIKFVPETVDPKYISEAKKSVKTAISMYN